MLKFVDRHEGVVIAALPEEVDFHTAPAVRAAGEALLADGCRSLILDASSVEYLDSSGITVLLGFWRRLGEAPGSLILAAPHERLRSMVAMLGLDSTLIMTTTSAEAVATARRLRRAVPLPSGRSERHGHVQSS